MTGNKTLSERQQDEQTRVDAMIERDKAERVREMERRRAEIEVRDGVFVNLADTVVEPTPEWIRKGDVRSYTPRQPDDTVRVVRTVRRVLTPVVARMWESGRLGDDQYRACLWYRDRFEAAGLEGRWSSSRYDPTSGGGSGGSAGAPIARHEYEARARAEYRAARSAITGFYLRFFEAIVLHDIPISRSWTFSRSPKHKAPARFRSAAQELAEFCRGIDVDLAEIGCD